MNIEYRKKILSNSNAHNHMNLSGICKKKNKKTKAEEVNERFLTLENVKTLFYVSQLGDIIAVQPAHHILSYASANGDP